jgi:hypothetical protein
MSAHEPAHIAEYGALVAAIDALHHPMKQEIERWPADGFDPPVLAACFVEIEVCVECGYDFDGDYPVFRPWPCPTWRAAHIDGRDDA